MATDELTAEQVEELSKHVCTIAETYGKAFRMSIPADPRHDSDIRLIALCQSHELLRADRDRLLKEREQLLDCVGETRKRLADTQADRDRLREERDEAETSEHAAWGRADQLEAERAKLREEIAAKDAEIQRWKNMSVSEFGQLKQQCAPMEDWRGANEDWRKR